MLHLLLQTLLDNVVVVTLDRSLGHLQRLVKDPKMDPHYPLWIDHHSQAVIVVVE